MLFVPLVFLSEGVKSLTKIIHCADLGIFGKKYCRVHDWSQKRKPPVLPHWGFSSPFLEQED